MNTIKKAKVKSKKSKWSESRRVGTAAGFQRANGKGQKVVKIFTVYFLLLTLQFTAAAQSGGTFSISHSVIANGGGQGSTGGTFSLSGTAGQHVVGTNPGGTSFVVQNGFWHGDLAPTAAGVSISGRVTTANGNGLRNAIVSLTDSAGNTRTARTASFGYYRFDDIEAGQTVVINVTSKRFHFTPRVLSVTDELTDVDFTALP